MTDFLVRLGVPRRLAKLALPVAATLIALLYPLFVGNLFSQFPSTRTAVVMLVYMMMAVGLNIVVGYAGLLDLGYVAFYAMGAYTAAWFSSIQFPNQNFHLWDVGVGSKVPGFHVSVWLLLPLAGILTAIVGVMIGLPTLRLRGDYLAIVTLGFGEIMPQIARNGDNLFGTGFNLTNGPNGITPLDSPGFGTLNYLQGSGTFFTSDRLFYWTALVLLLITIFCSWRLRDSRLGRAWIAIREDETAAAAMRRPADADEDLGVRDGRVLRRRRGRVLRELQERDVPGRLLLQHLGLHPLHGHPGRDGQHLGCDRRRSAARIPRPGRLGRPREPTQRRRAEIRVRNLRRHPARRDAVQAGGPDSKLAKSGGVPRGRA